MSPAKARPLPAPPCVKALAMPGGGWRVVVVALGGEGVAIWQRRAMTNAELRVRLAEAAKVRADSIAGTQALMGQ